MKRQITDLISDNFTDSYLESFKNPFEPFIISLMKTLIIESNILKTYKEVSKRAMEFARTS